MTAVWKEKEERGKHNLCAKEEVAGGVPAMRYIDPHLRCLGMLFGKDERMLSHASAGQASEVPVALLAMCRCRWQ